MEMGLLTGIDVAESWKGWSGESSWYKAMSEFGKLNMKTKTMKLTSSEVNTLIAGMLLCSVRYESINKPEAQKYKNLENKLRALCYKGDVIGECKLISEFLISHETNETH